MEEGKLVEWQAFFVNFIDSIDMGTIYDSAWTLGAGLLAAVGGSLWLISMLVALAKEWVKIDDAKLGQVLTDFMISGLQIVLYGFGWWIIFQIINLVFSYAAEGASIHSIFSMYAEALNQISKSENWFEKAMPNFNVLEYITFTIYFILFLGVMVAYAGSRIIHGLCLALAIVWGAITIPTQNTLKLMPSFWKLVGLVILWPLLDMIFMGFLAMIIQEPLDSLISSMVSGSFGFSSHILMVLELVMSFANILIILLIIIAPVFASRLLDNRGLGDAAGAAVAFGVKLAQDQANAGLSQGKGQLAKAYQSWRGGLGGGAGESEAGEASADAGSGLDSQDNGVSGMSFNGMNATSSNGMGSASSLGFGGENSSTSSGAGDYGTSSDNQNLSEPTLAPISAKESNAMDIAEEEKAKQEESGSPYLSARGQRYSALADSLRAGRESAYAQQMSAYEGQSQNNSSSENSSADEPITAGNNVAQANGGSLSGSEQTSDSSADEPIAASNNATQTKGGSSSGSEQASDSSADEPITAGNDVAQANGGSLSGSEQTSDSSADEPIAASNNATQTKGGSSSGSEQASDSSADEPIAASNNATQTKGGLSSGSEQVSDSSADEPIAASNNATQAKGGLSSGSEQVSDSSADEPITAGNDVAQANGGSSSGSEQASDSSADEPITAGNDVAQANGGSLSGSEQTSDSSAAPSGAAANQAAQADENSQQPELSPEEQTKKENAAAARRKAFMAKNRNAKLRGKQR